MTVYDTYLIVVCIQELSCQSVVHAVALPFTRSMDQPLNGQQLLPLHRQWIGNLHGIDHMVIKHACMYAGVQ